MLASTGSYHVSLYDPEVNESVPGGYPVGQSGFLSDSEAVSPDRLWHGSDRVCNDPSSGYALSVQSSSWSDFERLYFAAVIGFCSDLQVGKYPSRVFSPSRDFLTCFALCGLIDVEICSCLSYRLCTVSGYALELARDAYEDQPYYVIDPDDVAMEWD
jgi:hypothetical protein